MIINYLKENDNFGCTIQVSDERDRLLETGGGLRKAEALLGSDIQEFRSSGEGILICNVDILSNIDIPTLLQSYNPAEMGIVVVSKRDTQRYLLFNEENRLCGWTNIATGEVRPASFASSPYSLIASQLAFSGMQVLSPRIFDCMDDIVQQKGEKFSLIDLYLSIAQKEILRAYIPENYRMMDVGKINQLSEAEAFASSL
jgi:NDP-sugar pyrophosphorylase family protein